MKTKYGSRCVLSPAVKKEVILNLLALDILGYFLLIFSFSGFTCTCALCKLIYLIIKLLLFFWLFCFV